MKNSTMWGLSDGPRKNKHMEFAHGALFAGQNVPGGLKIILVAFMCTQDIRRKKSRRGRGLRKKRHE
jgi:hypothetical protein